MKLHAIAAFLLVFTGSALAATGADVYKSTCAACHQADAKGLPGVFPPLAGHVGNILKTGDKGRAYVMNVVLNGLQGKITVTGNTYNGVMPAQNKLSDAELAAVLNYVATSFGNTLPKGQKALTAADLKKQRAKPLTPAAVYKTRPAVK